MRNNITQIGGEVWINGKSAAHCPGVKNSKRITSVVKDDTIFINGYEYFPKEDCWKRTWKAFWTNLTAIF